MDRDTHRSAELNKRASEGQKTIEEIVEKDARKERRREKRGERPESCERTNWGDEKDKKVREHVPSMQGATLKQENKRTPDIDKIADLGRPEVPELEKREGGETYLNLKQ